MTPRPFEPKFMKLSVLTAALQELTPREIRDADPDRAILDWLEFAREMDCPNLQLSAALHPTQADVPPEAQLDPVANTLDLRQPFDAQRAKRVKAAMESARVGITDIAYFDDMLHEDGDLRRKKHAFKLRVFDAAAQLGLRAVCGFIGRNQALSMDAAGQGATRAHLAGLAGFRPQDRRGGSLHVRAAARGATGAGIPVQGRGQVAYWT